MKEILGSILNIDGKKVWSILSQLEINNNENRKYTNI